MPTTLITADRVRTADGVPGDAVLLDGDRIVAVGAAADLRADRVIDYPGATIVPGLKDAHLHPVGYAAALQRPSLKEAADFDELAEILAEGLRRQEPGTALTGLRLDDESLAEGRLPDRHLLDRVSTDRPILVMRYCGHVAVANTAALDLVGIGPDTPDPSGGTIDRDESGAPIGVLRETAFEPVTAALRPLAPAITPDDVVDGLTALASTGLTGVGAMAAVDSGLWGGAGSELGLLLEAAPLSPIRIRLFVVAATPDSLQAAAEQIEATPGPIEFAGVKMFSDGSFGGHTAAMHQPFVDRPGEIGTDRLDVAHAERMARTSLELGGRVAIHAIGDRANERMLDLMERLIERADADPADLRIEHASVLTERDIGRFGSSGVTASVQPAFVASEFEWLEKRLGPDRIERTYPFRSLLDAGAPVAGGSDSPVEPPHPLHGLAAARDRLGFVPAQCITGSEALRLFTTAASVACGWDGSLGQGRTADLTVLDRDPVESTPDEVRATAVLATWVGGKEIEIPAGIVSWQT